MRKHPTKSHDKPNHLCLDCKKLIYRYAKRCQKCHHKQRTKNPEIRFWKKVEKTGTCWLWVGRKNWLGYGTFRLRWTPKETVVPTHRFSWEIHNGKIPSNMKILHRCDVRNCVRPEHLWIGTQRENIADCVRKNRNAKGEKVHNAKLTARKVIQIRALYEKSKSLAYKLGKKFGVGDACVANIASRRNWKHI